MHQFMNITFDAIQIDIFANFLLLSFLPSSSQLEA